MRRTAKQEVCRVTRIVEVAMGDVGPTEILPRTAAVFSFNYANAVRILVLTITDDMPGDT